MNILSKKQNILPFIIVNFCFFQFLIMTSAYAQEPFNISNGDNVMQIGGIVSTYAQQRFYAAGITPKLENNTIKLKDARLDLNCKFGKDIDMHLQMDFAGWGSIYDPASPLIDDAHFTYKGWSKLFNIRVGYGKVPYSMNSIIDHEWTPFWDRPQVTKGDFFSRRDLGLRLDRNFWNQKIKLIAGIYTGTGEVVLGGKNDASGSYEYIGRFEIGYPERRTEYEAIIDTKVSNTPNIQLGINGRYSKRNLPVGTSFIPGEQGALVDDPYNFKVIDGKKMIYGGDVAFAYRGITLQAEAHLLKATFQDSANPLLNFTSSANNKGFLKAGGWLATANYYSKPLKSIFSARYEELNANDLYPGMSKKIAYSYCYQVKGFHSMIRAEYDKIISQTESINLSSWKDQFRIGWQLVIE